MYTSVLLLALSASIAPAASPEEPAWLTDYSSAKQKGRTEHKPLAVVLGTGESGWKQLSRDGQLGKDAQRLLAENYVCVYIDTDHKAGQRLASAFEIDNGRGI